MKNCQIKKIVDICLPKEGLKRGPFGSAIKKEFFIPDGFKVYEQSNAIYDDFERGNYFISEEKFNELKGFHVNEGDLIVSCSGTIGKIAVVPKNAKKGLINQALLRIRLDEDNVSKKYFIYYFRSQMFQQRILIQSQGTAMMNLVGMKDFKEVEIPIPPLETQHAIVSKIEELFSELDQGIADLKTAHEQLKVYRQSVLKHAFEGKLTNKNVKEGELPEGWELLKIKDVSKVINGDRSKNYPSRSHYVKDGIPFISAGTIDDNKINNTDINYITESKFDSLRSGKLEKRDLIYCLRGSLGKCAIYPFSKGAISSSLCIVRASELIEHEYLFYYLLSPFANNEILKYDNGTAQPNLSAKDFSNFEIPYTSKQEQHLIVQEIESRLSVADKMEESIQESLQKAEALRQSILKKAFSGELV